METFRRRLFEQAGSSKTYVRLAAFIWEHLPDVSYMTAEEVAGATGVSQATVTRFCARAGFDGFSSFQRTLQALMKERLSAPNRLLYAPRTPSGQTDRVVAADADNILKLDLVIRTEEFHRLVEWLGAAGRLVFLGARASATLVPYAHYFFAKIRENVHAVVPGTALWETLPADDPTGTLVVAFVFPRYPRLLLEQLAALRAAGFSVVAITDRPVSPAAAYAEQLFVVPVATTASVFDSYAAVVTFLNLLLRDMAREQGPKTSARLRAIEDLDQQRGVYHSVE